MAEGEDLLAAARAAGAEPVELLTAAGEGLGGTEVEPELLAPFSALGSGTRAIGVWRSRWADAAAAPCVYLHGVGDPGNVGAVIRTAHALVGGTVVLGPGCADPFRRRRCGRAWARCSREPLLRGGSRRDARAAGALVAHGGERARGARRGGDDLPRGRARGPARRRVERCDRAVDDPAARRAPSRSTSRRRRRSPCSGYASRDAETAMA